MCVQTPPISAHAQCWCHDLMRRIIDHASSHTHMYIMRVVVSWNAYFLSHDPYHLAQVQ